MGALGDLPGGGRVLRDRRGPRRRGARLPLGGGVGVGGKLRSSWRYKHFCLLSSGEEEGKGAERGSES